MSTLLDVPAQLAMVLALAAAGPAESGKRHSPEAIGTPAARVSVAPGPLVGPMRFGERQWLRALHENPEAAASRDFHGRVFVTSGGRYYIPRPADRQAIFDARTERAFAAHIAKAAAERNAERFKLGIGRRPAAVDLYVAHVFGAETAIELVQSLAVDPDAAAVHAVPEIVAALPEPETGEGYTLRELYNSLARAVGEPPRLVAIGMQRHDHVKDGGRGAGRVLSWKARVSTIADPLSVSAQ